MAIQDLTPHLRTRLRRVEKIVGLFVAVATLVLLAGFVYYLYHTANRKGWFVEKCPYYTYVQTGAGLKAGDPILLMGFSVGEIKTIEAQDPGSSERVFVGFEVRRPYYDYIWSESKAKIAAAGFLGQRQIEILPSYAGVPTVREKNKRVSEVLVDRTTGKMAPLAQAPKGVLLERNEEPALTERAEKLVGQVEKALPNILGLTIQIQAVLNNMGQATANATQLTSNLNHTVTSTQPILSNLTEITTNLRDPHGSLGEWIIPTNLQLQVSATIASVNTNLGSLNLTLLNLASITSNLSTQVKGNDQILSEISRLVVETDDLMKGLKRHWLLKSAFPGTGTNAVRPLLEPDTN